MITSDEYEQELLKALIHLNDPAYQPSDTLYKLMGCSAQDGVLTFEVTLLRAIEDLKPLSDSPSTSQTRLFYDLLYKRFVLKMTQEETAEHLHVSRTGIHRLQLKAVHILARALWGRCHPEEPIADGRSGQDGENILGNEQPNSQITNWNLQVQYELASLEKSAPRSVSNVEEVVANVQELITALFTQLGSHLEVNSLQPNLVADVHPSILSQMLIMVLERLARYGLNSQIILNARLEKRIVKIELICPNFIEVKNIDKEFVADILVPEGVSIEACLNDSQVLVYIKLPTTNKVTVLVVDDNPDMALFYHRSTEKTRYHIVHIRKGQELFETIEAVTPDIIVLDIVLPDVDGWRLLMRLHQNPATYALPVIICSVVRDEALALSLGAKLYLPKPVRPRQFLQALNQVFPPASAAPPISQASS
jgi:CheY-like chemotaxis protein